MRDTRIVERAPRPADDGDFVAAEVLLKPIPILYLKLFSNEGVNAYIIVVFLSMLMIFHDILFIVSSYSADITCASGYKLNPYRGTCTRFVRAALSWFDARKSCENSGEYLATFDTLESASWVRHQQLTAGNYLISLSNT